MKIKIVGDAFVIESSIKTEQLEFLKKQNPDALKIIDEETKDELFRVSYSKGNPSITSFGITFSNASRDDNKFATVTGTIPSDVADAKAYVADIVSNVAANLLVIEKNFEEAYNKAKEAREKLLDSIEVA